MYKTRPVLDRLIEKLHVDERGCWLYTGAKTAAGYGSIGLGRRQDGTDTVHRVIWQELIGPIPEGMWVDHLCQVRHCCNPDHLELVVPGENTRRGAQGRHGYCKRGHTMSPANTYTRPNGKTECRSCMRLAQLRRRGK